MGLLRLNRNNHVGFGVRETRYFNERHKAFDTYPVSSRINRKGKVTGVGLGYQRNLGAGFGALANYTYADGEEAGGRPQWATANTPPTWRRTSKTTSSTCA